MKIIMPKNITQILLVGSIVFPIIGFIMLFVHFLFSIFLFSIAGLMLFSVFMLLIIDRIKEKEEDDKNDYSDY